jgi:hypothetical protein
MDADLCLLCEWCYLLVKASHVYHSWAMSLSATALRQVAVVYSVTSSFTFDVYFQYMMIECTEQCHVHHIKRISSKRLLHTSSNQENCEDLIMAINTCHFIAHVLVLLHLPFL